VTGFAVVYDASVLYPSTLRDLLIRIAMSGLVRAKWTDQILDEVFGALRRDRPDLTEAKLNRTRELMGTAVRDWRVTNYEPLTDALQLPDPDDRHVLAAAIRAGAQVIVTSNLKHFPAKDLGQYDIDPKSPDDFVREQIDLNRDAVYAAVQQIADSWQDPPGTLDDVLDRLERSGLALSVAALRGSSPGSRSPLPE
jgi:predicted nucleic acid-binding protein